MVFTKRLSWRKDITPRWKLRRYLCARIPDTLALRFHEQIDDWRWRFVRRRGSAPQTAVGKETIASAQRVAISGLHPLIVFRLPGGGWIMQNRHALFAAPASEMTNTRVWEWSYDHAADIPKTWKRVKTQKMTRALAQERLAACSAVAATISVKLEVANAVGSTRSFVSKLPKACGQQAYRLLGPRAGVPGN